MSATDLDVEQLERLFELPAVNPVRVIKPAESNTQWINQCCVVSLAGDLTTVVDRCNRDTEVNLVLICPECGRKPRKGFCVEHQQLALSGQMGCGGCSHREKRKILQRVLEAFWRADQ